MLEELKHRSLEVWKLSRSLVKDIYLISRQFPDFEQYCLTSHIRKTSISILSNISEGAGRRTLKDRKRFYIIARASLTELDAQLQIALDLNYFKRDEASEIENKMRSIFKLLTAMLK